MPQYLSPGVYVEEVPSAVKPIAGVGTSTAAFVGQAADNVTMPAQPGKFATDSLGNQVNDSLGHPIPLPYTVAKAGEPQLITSWESFKNNFGDFQAGNRTLAHAVYGFFNNGGSRCWVTRVVDATSVTAVTNALAAFRAIDEIAIVAVPGALDSAIQGAVIAHCENAGDRFGILDGQLNPASLTPALIKGSTGNSNYAALYFPRIQVFDPVSNGPLYVAPSGHMAGIYARVDTQRGVHKAPANEVVLGAVGLEARLGKADQDGLNPAGINVIRNLNGNITVWGARTLGGDANNEWKYINVRRLFLFLRDSIDAGTQWVVFEPNDLSLWAKITRNVTAFLTNVWRSGALFGATPQEAFYVRCDATTNPPEVRDLGQVVTEIGVAVVKPAEFVIFRISQWAGPGK
jgi:phage tail sheath protein FI